MQDPEEKQTAASTQSISEKLASFPQVRPRPPLDLAAVDAAAAPHGFISREGVTPFPKGHLQRGRRRRATPPEATRHLAIRLVDKEYERFVAYADRHQLTYHDALSRLLDHAVD